MANAASALAAIRDADLPHPHGPLLEAFVHEFVDNERAASYLLQRCSADPGSGGLTAFLTDWIELISACKLSCCFYRHALAEPSFQFPRMLSTGCTTDESSLTSQPEMARSVVFPVCRVLSWIRSLSSAYFRVSTGN
jgi:hypothetical protein